MGAVTKCDMMNQVLLGGFSGQPIEKAQVDADNIIETEAGFL